MWLFASIFGAIFVQKKETSILREAKSLEAHSIGHAFILQQPTQNAKHIVGISHTEAGVWLEFVLSVVRGRPPGRVAAISSDPTARDAWEALGGGGGEPPYYLDSKR